MSLLLLFSGSGGNQWWVGTPAELSVAGTSGPFRRGQHLTGSPITIGVSGSSGVMEVDPLMVGSEATIGIGGVGGQFSGTGMPFGKTGATVLGKSKTDTRLHQSRTAMMVGTGRARTGER